MLTMQTTLQISFDGDSDFNDEHDHDDDDYT